MRRYFIFLIVLIIFALSIFSYGTSDFRAEYVKLRESIKNKYSSSRATVFSQWTSGVKVKIDTPEKVIAITLDACGGKHGNGYDKELIDFLRENKIPATLFMTGLWIDAHRSLVEELSKDPLFDIENHGLHHKPASVRGAVIYGRRGTRNVSEFVDEIELNARKIKYVTGKKSLFYRSGTAYYDDVAVKITYDLGYIPMNFSIISGDAAGFTPERIENKILAEAKNGAVIIAHMNRPGKNLYPAFKKVIPKLKSEGYRFVKLSAYKDQLQ
jgi:peptidoglycan/xylan/chitin deacetylase (PgdA/CDA1 family)